MASSPDRDLEGQLMEAGERLQHPLPSVDELLSLLDQVENCLSRVEQSPPSSMQDALSPSLNALIANELLRHSDVDVKVAVASCISEITRITAPDAPYDDDQMKEVFRLIVSSFKNLNDKYSISYDRRISILETVAKVRSCVVMLDLECDGLIIEMFQHFLSSIRDYHPETVFTSMETIMTLVLEESEDISVDLLIPILASVKKDSEEFLPIARKLGEKVFENCAAKLKPYMRQAVKDLGIFLDDYCTVVASICLEEPGAAEKVDVPVSGEHLADEGKLVRASSDEAAQVSEENAVEGSRLEGVDPAVDTCTKSVLSNGVTPTADDDSLLDSNSSRKLTSQSKNVNALGKGDPDDGKQDDLETKPEQTVRRRGRKPTSLMNSSEPSESSHIDGGKEADKVLERQNNRSKVVHDSPHDESSAEPAATLGNEKDTGVLLSSPKDLVRESVQVASPSPSGSFPDESRPRKGGRPKKRENLIKEAKLLADVSKKASEGTSDSEVKPHKRAWKKIPADSSVKEGKSSGDLEVKPLKLSGRKMNVNSNEDGSSSKQQKDRKRRGRGKAFLEKDGTKLAAEDDDKKMVTLPKSASKSAKGETQLEETSKVNSKRKRTPGKEKGSAVKDFGENLVGSKIKVWWPKDKEFYDGVIDSFDPVKKKHRVLYTDGDEEKLILKKERWAFREDESASDGEQANDHQSPDSSAEMHQKKKSKSNPDLSAKQGKMDGSSKRTGGASSSKTKAASSKPGRRSRVDGKDDVKSKDDAMKTADKSEDVVSSKSKSHISKSGSRSTEDVSKMASKSMDDEIDTPKPSNKSKLDTAKTGTKSTDKIPKSGSKSNVNGTGKVKSGLLKVKENEDVKEKSPDSGKALGSAKVKSSDSSKAHDSEAKSGKKRRRS